MVVPVRVGEERLIGAVVGIGRRNVMGENTARNLSVMATAVAGSFLGMNSNSNTCH